MPEKETLRANTAQILRNIQTFNERLKKRRERFGFISNNQEEIVQKEPLILKQSSVSIKLVSI